MTGIRALYVAAIFLGAFLLFWVQPLATRLLLPRFGGSPSVWNVALVFFQAVLLLGYLYAHLLPRLGGPRARLALHGAVLLLPLLFLPPALPGWLAAAAGAPWPVLGVDAPAVLVLLALAAVVGPAFFVLSTNSSLVQHWWARGGLPGAADPYWLYGASNVGSLLALLAYPFVVEPALGVGGQAELWTAGYAAFALLTLGVMGRVWFAGSGTATAAPGAAEDPPAGGASLPPGAGVGAAVDGGGRRRGSPEGGSAGRRADGTRVGMEASEAGPRAAAVRPVTPLRRAGWAARAAVASSLLLALTLRMTTDVASVPLFWVVPLAVYLATWILAFARLDRLRRGWVGGGAVLGITLSLGLLVVPAVYPLDILVPASLWTLFFGALLCHRDLAADRPSVEHLTGFYLWIAFGGALGGALNSLVAPVVFDSMAELPLTLAALAVLLHLDPEAPGAAEALRPRWLLGALAAAGLLVPLGWAVGPPDAATAGVWAATAGFAGLWGLALVRYAGLFGVSVVLLAAVHLSGVGEPAHTLARERSFFGVVEVREVDGTRRMVHGTTIHGSQSLDPDLRGTPGSYYHPEGPMGAAVEAVAAGGRIGVVGLGAGALAAYVDPGQTVVFHEIDPLVVRLARTWFSYLDEAAGDVELVLGDGRLTLEDARPRAYDLLVVDAFSSDFVPTHLLTVEALELYLSRVASDGLVLLHISNRQVDLRRVLRGWSEHTARPVAFADHRPSLEAAAEGATRSLVAAVAPDPATIRSLTEGGLWTRFAAGVEAELWTDDRSDLLGVLRREPRSR